MKKVYIVAIALIAVAVVILTTASNDMSTYATFKDASAQMNEKVKVVGQLAKDKAIVYDPMIDPNITEFFVKDADGMEQRVKLLKSKPQDFELSEQVVLTGKMQEDGTFLATDILMKCPSKYKDEELFVKAEQG